MDPLSAADTVLQHSRRILQFIRASRTNTKECEEVCKRVETLRQVAEQIQKNPCQLLERQVENVEMVMSNAEAAVMRYSSMSRGLQRAWRFVQAVPIKQQFANIGAALDSVLQDLLAALNVELRTIVLDVQAHVHGIRQDIQKVQDQLAGKSILRQLNECATEMLQMRLPEHLVSLDDKVHAVQDIMNHVDTEVVVLVGMGGIGKTTLAKAVYESERSRNNFDEIAWVTMGRDPNILQCLQQIWAQLVSSERNPSCSNMEDLKSEHLSTLKKKCVLLVLDDVWSVNSLEKLKITVSNGDSRLLVTSRDMKVARGVGAKVYDVGLLDKNSSLELFCKCAFGMPGIPDEKVKYRPFVEQMVMQCAQLPLALQVVGSLAREFRQLAEWEAGVSRLQQSRSLGAVYEDDLLSVLRISYEDLDDFQKAFFFCLVCYPEDSHVKVSDLVEQWVACLDVEADSDVEDCFLDGYTICLQLMDRSLFMYDAVPESAGDADMMNNTSCYLHDFLREVGLRLASKDRPLAAREKLLFPNLHQLRDKTVMARHLSTCGDASNCWREGFEAPSMVSLISRDSGLTALPSKLVLSPHLRILDLSRSAIGEISPSIREISLLQVLRLDGCNGVSMLPKELTDLSHLTVLSLRDCPGLQSLPESLGNLTRLHSLFIGCHKLQHLPASIVNATRMRRLDLSGCEILMSLPDGLGQFSYLQVLSLAGCKDITSIPQSLGFITGLQVLCLSWCRGITVLPNEIGLLSHLQTLDLSECRGLTRLPESVTQLCELQTLNLNGCWSLTWIPDDLRLLCGLKSFPLSWCRAVVQIPEGLGLLVRLKTLNLSMCDNINEIPHSVGALSQLRTLNLSWCVQLTHIPDSVGLLSQLHTLDLSWCRSLTQIPESLGLLSQLKVLDLRECRNLTRIPDNVGSLCRLQRMELSKCASLVEIPEAIGLLSCLRSLNLSGCSNLLKIAEGVGLLSQLESLDLSRCGSLRQIPDIVGLPHQLAASELSERVSLEQIPEGVWPHGQMDALGLGRSSSQMEIPNSVGSLSQLKRLDLSKCVNLTHIPETIGSLSQIQILNLSGCLSLKQIPENVGLLTQLEILNLSGCGKLAKIPESMGSLKQLQMLDLSWCKSLPQIPQSIGLMTELRALNLTGCSSLVHIPESVSMLAQLKTLQLQWCKNLMQIPDGIGALGELETLNLSGCGNLTHVPESVLALRKAQGQ